jgi:site-specific recombinase XerD
MSALPSLPHSLEDFFRLHLVARRNLSPNTVHTYRDALVLLLRFAAKRARRQVADLDFEHVGQEIVLAFLDDLETSRGNSIRTRNARLAVIRSFFRFVAAEEPACSAQCRRILAVPFKRRAHVPPVCLDRADVDRLLAMPDVTTHAGRRDAALFWFLYNTGARAQEVVDVHLGDIRFTPPLQVRLRGKGRKERLCPLWPQTVALLRDMIRDHPGATDERLFRNYAGRPLTRFGLGDIVRRYAARSTLTGQRRPSPRISPHTFRHTTALHLLQSGVDITVVRSWLGHASIETTHEYVEIDMEAKRAALEAASPTPQRRRPPRWRAADVLVWLESL